MKKQIHLRTVIITLFILLASGWRLLTNSGHIPTDNFTPIGAMALFGGCYFATRLKAFILPLMSLFVSDVILQQTVYAEYSNGLLYQGWIWTYVAFASAVVIGSRIGKVSFISVAMVAILAALSHWIISDFGVWIGGHMYTKDWSGFVQCYVAALPFLKKMLIGNLTFSFLMFGLFELAQRRFPVLSSGMVTRI